MPVPAGQYEVSIPNTFLSIENKLYATGQQKPAIVVAKTGQKTEAAELFISVAVAPDLIPAKGVLHDFTSATAQEVDRFIETYQRYYGIPGEWMAYQ